jgi:hypothetical protein
MPCEEDIELLGEAKKNKPKDPKKWSSCIAQAKKKFEVYPSAYANAWAAKDYKKHGGTWRKSKKKYMLKEHNMPSFNEWLEKRENQ